MTVCEKHRLSPPPLSFTPFIFPVFFSRCTGRWTLKILFFGTGTGECDSSILASLVPLVPTWASLDFIVTGLGMDPRDFVFPGLRRHPIANTRAEARPPRGAALGKFPLVVILHTRRLTNPRSAHGTTGAEPPSPCATPSLCSFFCQA